MTKLNTTNRMVREFARVLDQPAPAAQFDFYTSYCSTFRAVYGDQHCPTREQWDAMCKAPRTVRKLTDDEFDDNQFSNENGDGEII